MVSPCSVILGKYHRGEPFEDHLRRELKFGDYKFSQEKLIDTVVLRVRKKLRS